MNSRFTPHRSVDPLLAAIVDSSEDAIISKDLNTIVTSWNKSAERMFGYAADEMIGQPISRLFPPDRLDEEAVIIRRIVNGERVEHFETVRVRHDGTPIDVSLTISPIRDAAGVIVGASKIARDITGQKQTLRNLAEAHERLQRADRIKVEFLATLSHELRTPLTAIMGWIQILEEDPTAQDLSEGLQVIARNVRLQSRLIEDLLDMSRIESGKVSLDLQHVNLVSVVTAALETLRPTASSKEIRLTSSFTSVEGTVMGDRNRLQQVVWNLVSNALKFTPRGGKVHVIVHRINSHVEISVVDTGQGIPLDFLPFVFDRFRQADASTTRKYGGLGIGLAIAKNLTELHGGKITVSSDGLGTGSTFTVQLPLVSVHQSQETKDAETRNAEVDGAVATGNLSGVRVFALDDDPDSLGVIERILQKNGAEVKTAISVDDALAVLDSFHPHVIVSDIGMPLQDGYEFIKRLRSRPGGHALPAVALTALARTEDRTRALRAGFQMHVAKPVDANELVAIIQNLASLRSPSV
ncbi:MAG: ATP-binding protein [Chthoniobacter sp.]